jgi:hypothetical protein
MLLLPLLLCLLLSSRQLLGRLGCDSRRQLLPARPCRRLLLGQLGCNRRRQLLLLHPGICHVGMHQLAHQGTHLSLPGQPGGGQARRRLWRGSCWRQAQAACHGWDGRQPRQRCCCGATAAHAGPGWCQVLTWQQGPVHVQLQV